jgi:adenosine deaminase
MTTASWSEQIPKVELHLHMEGAIPLGDLWELICKYGGSSDTPTVDSLADRFQFRDFPHFLETWKWKTQFIREYEDLELIAAAVARDLKKQNIRYAEMFYSPPDFKGIGLETQGITEAIRKGLSKVDGIEIALVADLVRNYGPSAGLQTLREVEEVRELGVVGIGLGGMEYDYPPEPYEQVFHEARELGFKTSAHAGEGAGPESVEGALDALLPDRIGHATRAIEDPQLVDRLEREQIPLELCPISNVRTQVVETFERSSGQTLLPSRNADFD